LSCACPHVEGGGSAEDSVDGERCDGVHNVLMVCARDCALVWVRGAGVTYPAVFWVSERIGASVIFSPNDEPPKVSYPCGEWRSPPFSVRAWPKTEVIRQSRGYCVRSFVR